MSQKASPIKQIAAGRRKPDMTRKEYFDHRFRVHGAIADDTEDKTQKPLRYIQTQVFDSAFGSRADGPLNANQHWCGRDDTTELYFHDWDHVKRAFSCDHVKEKVQPDGPLFADFESSIVLMAREKDVPLSTRLASGGRPGQRNATVAMYFIATPEDERNGQKLEEQLSPALIQALETNCQDEVWGLVANVGEVSEHFDLKSYFGGGTVPEYALVYKIYMRGPASVPAMRRCQKEFVAGVHQLVDQHKSFILFSEEVVVLDVENNVRFDLNRQPVWHDLPGPSHLDC